MTTPDAQKYGMSECSACARDLSVLFFDLDQGQVKTRSVATQMQGKHAWK